MNEFSDRSSILLVSTIKKHVMAERHGVFFCGVDFGENRTPKGLHAEKQSGGLFFRAKISCGYRIAETQSRQLGRNLSIEPFRSMILRVDIVLLYFKSNI